MIQVPEIIGGVYAMLEVKKLIERHRFRFGREIELQDGIAMVLAQALMSADREHRLGPADIVDFLTESGVGIEVKIGGGLSDVTRQLHRYAQHDAVKALLLVTTRSVHRGLPTCLHDKPVAVCVVGGGLL